MVKILKKVLWGKGLVGMCDVGWKHDGGTRRCMQQSLKWCSPPFQGHDLPVCVLQCILFVISEEPAGSFWVCLL